MVRSPGTSSGVSLFLPRHISPAGLSFLSIPRTKVFPPPLLCSLSSPPGVVGVLPVPVLLCPACCSIASCRRPAAPPSLKVASDSDISCISDPPDNPAVFSLDSELVKDSRGSLVCIPSSRLELDLHNIGGGTPPPSRLPPGRDDKSPSPFSENRRLDLVVLPDSAFHAASGLMRRGMALRPVRPGLRFDGLMRRGGGGGCKEKASSPALE
mmetsp:Transcript_5204/g.17280  ORF Transcript_5204/g.17280 Transcript_5204/m.17280 type:complete len:211 (+) Transcript_5204:1105-1737(+)